MFYFIFGNKLFWFLDKTNKIPCTIPKKKKKNSSHCWPKHSYLFTYTDNSENKFFKAKPTMFNLRLPQNFLSDSDESALKY